MTKFFFIFFVFVYAPIENDYYEWLFDMEDDYYNLESSFTSDNQYQQLQLHHAVDGHAFLERSNLNQILVPLLKKRRLLLIGMTKKDYYNSLLNYKSVFCGKYDEYTALQMILNTQIQRIKKAIFENDVCIMSIILGNFIIFPIKSEILSSFVNKIFPTLGLLGDEVFEKLVNRIECHCENFNNNFADRLRKGELIGNIERYCVDPNNDYVEILRKGELIGNIERYCVDPNNDSADRLRKGELMGNIERYCINPNNDSADRLRKGELMGNIERYFRNFGSENKQRRSDLTGNTNDQGEKFSNNYSDKRRKDEIIGNIEGKNFKNSFLDRLKNGDNDVKVLVGIKDYDVTSDKKFKNSYNDEVYRTKNHNDHYINLQKTIWQNFLNDIGNHCSYALLKDNYMFFNNRFDLDLFLKLRIPIKSKL